MSIGQNMILINSAFRNVKSFMLIPVSNDCPYNEMLFDPVSNVLVIITKSKKESFHMLPRLDDNGEPVKLKFPNKETGKTVKEQRVSVNTFSEFYLSDKEDIVNMIRMFAINAESFNFEEFLKQEEPESPIITKV